MLTLDPQGQFTSDSKPLGITATRKRGRWQYRDTDTKRLYASGMEPGRFAAKFWFRNDYTETN